MFGGGQEKEVVGLSKIGESRFVILFTFLVLIFFLASHLKPSLQQCPYLHESSVQYE